VATIDTDKTGSIFLATTAMEEFWDTSMPIVFLGEWCQRYSRRSFWEPLGGRIIETPWSGNEKIIKTADYVNALYERILPVLADEMNILHGVNHSVRYWRILLGPWLLYYLPVVYDRYICLQKALNCYPELTTKVLAEESWITPVDTLEFIQLLKGDPYNLQIFSRLLKLMGREYPSQNMQIMPATSFSKSTIKSKLKFVVAAGTQVASNLIAGLHQNKVVFTQSPYFSRLITARLFLKSGFTVLPLFEASGIQKSPFEVPLRKNMVNSSWASSEFERLLSNMISIDMPQSFVEGFKLTRRLASENYPENTHAILSANSWYYDETFKQWAATSSEKGTHLLGAQHGGNYGSSLFHPSEEHEIAITDRYYTWGWPKNNEGTCTIVPISAAKFIGRKPVDADNQKKGILYVATSLPRYLFQFPYVPMFLKEYLEWQTRFVKKVSQQIIPELRVRLHREDLGWDIGERWNTDCPEISREGWETPFATSMQKCRLYVSDNLQTTFIEGLAVNKPGILFWNPQHNLLRPEAEPYYDQLRSVGILHDSPEEAAQVVNQIYADVENWWNEPQRQSARRNFCARFARTSSKAVEEWVTELKQIASSNTPCAQDGIPLDV